MERIKEKLLCIFHIIFSKYYAIYTVGYNHKKHRIGTCCYTSRNSTKEFFEAIITETKKIKELL